MKKQNVPLLTVDEQQELHEQVVTLIQNYFVAHGADQTTFAFGDVANVALNILGGSVMALTDPSERNTALNYLIHRLEQLRITHVH